MSDRRGVFGHRAFARFWFADAVSNLGTFTSALAVQLLLIENLGADQTDIGVVRAAQWLPSLLFGLLAGVLVDRMRRRTVLIAADSCAAVLTAAVAVTALTGVLSVPLMVALAFATGIAVLLSTAARQVLLPDVVPATALPAASARLEQTWNVAQSLGPLVGGALVRFLTAPIAIAVDAVSYGLSALVMRRTEVDEIRTEAGRDVRILRELREGASWLYRHRTLGPYAVALHLWFFFNSAIVTVLVHFASTELQLDAFRIGIALACAGGTGVVAAGVAPRLAERFGAGRVCVVADWLTPIGYAVVLVGASGSAAFWWFAGSQAVFGLGLGLKGPPETSYRNLITPNRLRGRMNGCMRTFNWGAVAVSAPLAGWAAATWGDRSVIAVGIAGLVVAAVVLMCSPFRTVTLPNG